MSICGSHLRRLAVLAVAAAFFAVPVAAHAATHTFGTTTPGGSFGCPNGDYKYGNEYTLGESGSVTQISAWMKGGGTGAGQDFRTMIYAADGAGGAPGTLLGTSQTVFVSSSAPAGEVDFPFTTPVSLTPGSYWLAQQSKGETDGGSACLSGTGSGNNNFNPDPFADGPSNPFNASGPIQTDTNLWTLWATYTTAPVDTTPPVITATASPAANANGWRNSSVVVTFTCTDEAGGSGVASVTAPITLAGDGANQSATGTCKDNAGNTSTATASGINIDKTAPAISYSSHPATYTVDQNVGIACAATDALSGVDLTTLNCQNVSAPAYTLGLGSHTLTATVSDKAGNAAGTSTTFAVTVTAGSLCNLTAQLIQGSARYQALSNRSRAAADALLSNACRAVENVSPRLNPLQKRLAVALYDVAVQALSRSGWLTDGQADTLRSLAGSL